MDLKSKRPIHIAAIALVILTVIVGQLIPAYARNMFYIGCFGLLALFDLIFVLTIPVIHRYARGGFSIYCLANRRWIGLYVFIFAAIHVALVFTFMYHANFNVLINAIASTQSVMIGAIAFVILIALALTSNDFMVRTLGKNWKRFQLLTYLVLVLVLMHSFSLVGPLHNPLDQEVILILIAAIAVIKFVLPMMEKKQPVEPVSDSKDTPG